MPGLPCHRRDRGFVQIAGVHNVAEAQTVEAAGADMVGIPLRLDVHAEDLSEDEARAVVRALRIPVCLITYLHQADDIIAFAGELGVGWVQLHGPVSLDEHRRLRERAPLLGIIKSVVVGREDWEITLNEVHAIEGLVDALITDTYDPVTGASGATGKVHDWALSREVVAATERPVILAGGLNSRNVAGGIAAVRPAGVDAHTGVEQPDGRKSFGSVGPFIQNAHNAFLGLTVQNNA